MTLTTRVPATIDYLVSTFTAAPTLGAATPPVAVYDGAIVTNDPSPLALWVGMDDPGPDQLPTCATSDQTWAGLGKSARNEQFSIFCVAEAWTGGTLMQPVRTSAYGIVAAVETLLHADANLGGNILVLLHGVTGLTLRQVQTSIGAVARVTFQIDCKARL